MALSSTIQHAMLQKFCGMGILTLGSQVLAAYFDMGGIQRETKKKID